MAETTKKGNGLGIAGFVIGIIAVIFSFIPLMGWLTWILAILALIFGLIGCFGNKKSKGLALIAVILAVGAVCINRFYTAPKVANAAGELFKEVIKEASEKSDAAAADAIEEATEALQETTE